MLELSNYFQAIAAIVNVTQAVSFIECLSKV